MPVYKDKNGSWYVMTRCDDWQGKRKQKCKRGFKTKREAQDSRPSRRKWRIGSVS